MRILLLHPEDFPQRGPWSAQRWDLIVDLGRSSPTFAAAREEVTHTPVLRTDSFRRGVEDIKQVGRLFSLGLDRLLGLRNSPPLAESFWKTDEPESLRRLLRVKSRTGAVAGRVS